MMYSSLEINLSGAYTQYSAVNKDYLAQAYHEDCGCVKQKLIYSAKLSYTADMSRSFCSRFHHAAELVGRRWNGAILQAVFAGRHRYADIRGAVAGLSDTMLAQRLRELEAEGILERRVLPTSPVAVEYYLMPKGQALAPVLDALSAWAHEWVTAPADAASETAPPDATLAPPAGHAARLAAGN
jgi:DNA-binding HxlR family transcriptional regulator